MATGGRHFNYLTPQYGTIAGGATLEITTGTIAGWIKNLDETIAGGLFSVMSGAFAGYWFTWERGGFAQRLTFWDSVDWRFSAALSAGALDDGNWHHIAVTFATGGDVKFYVDGVQSGTTATAGTISTAGGATQYFNFSTDSAPADVETSEWAIWSSALSGTDIANLAGGDSPQAVASGTLLEHWRFNETGSTITGQVNGLDITLSNSPGVSSDGPPVDDPSGSGGGLLLLARHGMDDMDR